MRHVILDRDGVLNRERADGGPPHCWAEWQWLPGSRSAVVMLSRAGVRLSVVTNQSGIGRGTLAPAAMNCMHAHMAEDIHGDGGLIDRVLVCPHAPDVGCSCRKPLPGLLLQAVRASGIPPETTIAVGDDLRDIEAARAANLTAVLVRTGKGRTTEGRLETGTVAVFDDLHAVVVALLANTPKGVIAAP
ncbi:MAG: HAD-IIIA family hydrolase [Rhodanobacteraceae bacterium]|nr:MAG: HAD-IIIA family hydrolase [Rhodanobacteraceae bacterium]